MTSLRFAAILCACLVIFPARADETGAYAKFRAWIVGCDNGRACRAYGFSSSEAGSADTGVFLRIDRGAAATAEPELALSVATDAPGPGTVVTVSADGTDLGRLTLGDTLKTESDGSAAIIRDVAVRNAILAALKKAATLRISLAPPPGGGTSAPDPVAVSLDGAAAALLWIDDRQKRVGTVTALARPGEQPASAVPAPPALPLRAPLPHANLPPAPKAAPREVMAAWKTTECAEEQGSDRAPDAELHRLDRNTLLIALPCGSGAYNFASAFFLYRESGNPRVTRLTFEDPTKRSDVGAQQPDTTLTNADFDEAKLDISFFAKGRGPADCGAQGRYRWDGRGFRPIRLDIMPECNGVDSSGWITVWRSRE